MFVKKNARKHNFSVGAIYRFKRGFSCRYIPPKIHTSSVTNNARTLGEI